MESNSEDGGHLIHNCPPQQDATQYRVMYSQDRNTNQVCYRGGRFNTNTNVNMSDFFCHLKSNTFEHTG